jgi:protein involved in polysaccharide export with SLBB domain
MRVRDLVVAAGNPRRAAYLKNAEISRIKKTEDSVSSFSITINLEKALADDPEHNIILEPYDELIIRKIPNWAEETDRYVTLKGEVMFPGTYPIFRGEHISSVIDRAGGFTDKAYLRGAKFTRSSVREEQQKRLEEIVARAELQMQTMQSQIAATATSAEELEANRASIEGLRQTLGKLKAAKAEGRVVMHLSEPTSFKGGMYDLELMGGDVLEVPKTPGSVNVLGQVYNPTTFVCEPGQTVSYYLRQAGGPTRDAEKGDMYIIRADGSVFSRQHASFGLSWDDYAKRWSFGGFGGTSLEPGDTLVVPQQLMRTAWMRDIKDITSILSQAAITAGIIIAAGL